VASLRFSFDGERRQASGHSFGWKRPAPFLVPGGHGGRGLYPFISSVYVTKEDRDGRGTPCTGINKGEAAPAEAKPEPDKALPAPQSHTDGENREKEIKALGQKETIEGLNGASEKLISFLETAETGLTGLKAQLNMFRGAFNEILFKLDSFAQLLDIIRSNEERKFAPPEAALSSQTESKDTLDELLEILQTPAFQVLMRRLALSFMIKNSGKVTSDGRCS